MNVRRLLAPAAALALVATFVAAPSHARESGYYSVPYDSTLLFHDHGYGTYEAEFSWWAEDGFPAPVPAPVDYVKYPWSSTIYAVHFFESDRGSWVWEQLTFEQWSRAGRPAARDAGWIEGSAYYRFDSSAELFVESPNVDEPLHKMTPGQWAAAGSPAPTQLSGQGFYRYPWSSSIGYLSHTPTGDGTPLSYEQWMGFGMPTPQTVTNVANEHVWRFAGYSQLYLDSPITGWDTPINYAQWTSLGRPAPATY